MRQVAYRELSLPVKIDPRHFAVSLFHGAVARLKPDLTPLGSFLSLSLTPSRSGMRFGPVMRVIAPGPPGPGGTPLAPVVELALS